MGSVTKSRVRVELRLDADLLAAIDAYVSRNPGSHRSAVIDDALRLWQKRRQELTMERQLRADSVRGGVEPAEWRRVRSAAARRRP